MPTNGLVVMTPTSISSTGTGNSSSINADGSVDFATCATLELRGVFNTSYDNYMVTVRAGTAANIQILLRLMDGTTEAATNYARQYLQATSTTVNGGRATAQTGAIIAESFNVQKMGVTVYVFGPKLAEPTAGRAVGALDELSASIIDPAWTHSTSTGYDGLKLYTSSSSMSGLVTVFGFNQ